MAASAEEQVVPACRSSYHEMVRRAVRAAAAHRSKAPRWVQVMRAFALGSTAARELCRKFELDPDEEVGEEEDLDEDE